MEGILITGLVIFACIAVYQQIRIIEMEEQTFNALKKTCETLDLIKKGATIKEILELREAYEQQN